MPSPVSVDADLEVRVRRARAATCTRPPRGRELDRVGEQVPEDLLQAVRVAGRRARRAGRARVCSRIALGVGGGPHGVDRRPDDGRQVDPLHVQPHLAGDDAAHVQQVLDDLRLRAGVALDDLAGPRPDRPASSRRRCARICDQPRIALSGVRSSWLSVARNSSFMRLCSASDRAPLAGQQFLACDFRLLSLDCDGRNAAQALHDLLLPPRRPAALAKIGAERSDHLPVEPRIGIVQRCVGQGRSADATAPSTKPRLRCRGVQTIALCCRVGAGADAGRRLDPVDRYVVFVWRRSRPGMKRPLVFVKPKNRCHGAAVRLLLHDFRHVPRISCSDAPVATSSSAPPPPTVARHACAQKCP